MKKVMIVVAALVALFAMNYGLALWGEPRAQWAMCDMLKLCRAD